MVHINQLCWNVLGKNEKDKFFLNPSQIQRMLGLKLEELNAAIFKLEMEPGSANSSNTRQMF